MENVYKKMGFIIAFLSSVLAINMFAGEKFTEKYLLIVLGGIALYNYQAVNSFLKKTFTTTNTKTGNKTGTTYGGGHGSELWGTGTSTTGSAGDTPGAAVS